MSLANGKGAVKKASQIATSSKGQQKSAIDRSPKTSHAGTVLRLHIDGKRLIIRRDDLHDSDKLAGLEKSLRGAKSVAIKNVAAFLEIPPGQRIWLLRLLANLPDGAVY